MAWKRHELVPSITVSHSKKWMKKNFNAPKDLCFMSQKFLEQDLNYNLIQCLARSLLLLIIPQETGNIHIIITR